MTANEDESLSWTGLKLEQLSGDIINFCSSFWLVLSCSYWSYGVMFYWFADSKESKASSSSPPLNKSKEELSYSKKLFSLLELDFGTKMLSWFERNGSIFSVTFGGWAMIPSFIKSLILSLWIMISPNVGSYWIESFLISLWIRPAAILSNISASESIYDVAVLKLLFELYSRSFIDIGLLWANG